MASPKANPIPPLPVMYIERFWSYVDKTPGWGPWGNCWKWNRGTARSYTTKDGLRYGVFWVGCLPLLAHRMALYLTTNVDLTNLLVLHSCDWPPCCNPEHLSVGDDAANNADMIFKGRQVYLAGQYHGNAKLTDAQVLEIRHLRAAGERLKPLGKQYGVAAASIARICRREAWKHIL